MNLLFSRLIKHAVAPDRALSQKESQYEFEDPRGGVRIWSLRALRTTKRTFGKEAVVRFENRLAGPTASQRPIAPGKKAVS